MDGWMDGRTGGWADGRTDGQTGGRVDGCTKEQFFEIKLTLSLHFLITCFFLNEKERK